MPAAVRATRAPAVSIVAASLIALVAMGTPPGAVGAQQPTPPRDTGRTVIIDSVQRVFLSDSVPRSSQQAGHDLARTIDAEVRVALFELVAGDELPALSRLQRVADVAGRDATSAALPERAALQFLLAQSYYRLGMLAAFRTQADSLMAGPHRTRYASLLQPQLVVDAYRRGEYARAAELSRGMERGETSGLATLVAGLAEYQTSNLTEARAAFQQAAAGTGEFASYARYMDALTQLRADTAQEAPALTALEQVATSASGTLAEQARLTAAQVAYEAERYDDAVRLASAVPPSSAVAASALLTRAWALYKLERVDEAQQAFSEFASTYPQLPERDEARLMAAQALLELGRAPDAERMFRTVADSTAAEVTALQGETNAALGAVAKALVGTRSAGLLFVADPASAKALVLHDSAAAPAADAALLAVAGGAAPPATTVVPTTARLTHADVSARLDSIAGDRASPTVKRVLFAPASATRHPQELGARTQTLLAADAAVAVARYRVAEQLEAQQRELALLTQLQSLLAVDSAAVMSLGADYRALNDSLARLDQMMAAAEARLRALFQREIEGMRALAAENARTADSLRTALGAAADPVDQQTIEAEVSTAAAYQRIADIAQSGLGTAIARHPAFAMRDSVRAHAARTRGVLDELEGAYGGARRGLAAAIALLRGGDGPAVRASRQALADAEARRGAVEGEVIAAVNAELAARAGEMIASLQRDVEAAQFGLASAAFFQAIDATRAVGANSPRDASPERRR